MSTESLPAGMGRCEITGKIVPLDELVEINNQQVCAEGKQILLERLKSGEAMPGELERPTVLRRFACMFVDGLVMWVVTIPLGLVIGVIAAAMAGSSRSTIFIAQGLAAIFAAAFGIIYFGLMHGMRGQSLGKMAGKLKVVRMDGQPMDIKTGFVRAFFLQGPSLVQGILLLTGIALLMPIGLGFVGIYAIANILVALFDRNQQRALHDRLAGTRVVTINS